ncbi:MAG TPA: hypothetical protein VFZ25_02070 [Chloroflexota bacterium]|nr:hypothetical protein [Chloroflexota bacterium]
MGALALATLVLGSVSLAQAVSVQHGNLRISVFAQVKPYKLPRQRPAPITVAVAGHLQSTTGSIPPQLQSMRIEVNRHGLLQSKGLPTCSLPQLAGTATAKALQFCDGALIGSGRFWAHIVLPDQGAYPTRGDLLIFNGRHKGAPVLLVHIFTSDPFNSAFTIMFTIRKVHKGVYGTELQASLPEALGEWGYVDRIKLNLKREYRAGGRTLSYFNAACPALPGANRTAFPLARAKLSFSEQSLTAAVVKSCGVKE